MPTNDLSLDARLAALALDDLPDASLQRLLQNLTQKREMPVGEYLVVGLTDAQLLEFEQLTADGDQTCAQAWLNHHLPGYQKTVQEELTRLLDEVRDNLDQIRREYGDPGAG